jgi:uncharacterized protein
MKTSLAVPTFILSVMLSLSYGSTVSNALAAGPSFDCGKVQTGSIEEMICKDDGLSALDRKMAKVYTEASKKAVNEHPPVLKPEQRGWVKGRNDCRNESLWEHQGEASIVWGYGSPEMRCSRKP